MTEVTFVEHYEGDWVALYVDDERVYQGHSITPFRMLMELIGLRITQVHHIEANAEDYGAQFPESLRDI